MKKFIFSTVVSCALLVPVIANANSVFVTATYVRGTMESGGTHTHFIRAYGSTNSTVYFDGRDPAGNYFSCFVPVSSSIYQAASDIRNNMTDGTYMLAAAPATGKECTRVFHRKDSRDMHH